MLVGQGDDEAVQPLGLQLLAQGGKAGLVGRHGKILEAGYLGAR
jgi:hypothetical protein